jgi:PPOX class probable F420-dependent enzyme
MKKMTREEWRAFMMEGTRTGKLATVRTDGRPHVVPLWFVLDGDDVVFNTGKDSVKGKTLQRDHYAALCVDDERPPFAFVTVEGSVILSEDPKELLDYATRIGGRYMGTNRAEEFGKRNGVPGELLVRLHIEKVTAVAGLTD